jgi:nicotinate-nucleotide adenylyltransferase
MGKSQVNAPLRLGIFGGSFDPVHLGHLLAAQDALEQVNLDRVIFMPASRAPLKDRAPGATGEQRVALLRAAIADDPRFAVSPLELERGGVSYTIDTARALRQTHPGAELFWIIGTDQAGLLPQWRDIAALGELVQFVVLARPGFGLPAVAHRPAGLRLLPVAVHEFAISSSEIRLRLAARKPVRLFLPAPVADLIERDHLYRPTTHAHTA